MSHQVKGPAPAIAYARFGKSNSKSKRSQYGIPSQYSCDNRFFSPKKMGNSQDIAKQDYEQTNSSTDIFSAIMGTMKADDYDYITKIKGKCEKNQTQKSNKGRLNQAVLRKQQSQNMDLTNDQNQQLKNCEQHLNNQNSESVDPQLLKKPSPLKDISSQNNNKLNRNSHIKSNSHLNLKLCQRQASIIDPRQLNSQNHKRGFLSQRERRSSDLIPQQMNFQNYASKTAKTCLSTNNNERSGIFLRSLDKYMNKLNKNENQKRNQNYLGQQTNGLFQTIPLKSSIKYCSSSNKKLCEQTNSLIQQSLKQRKQNSGIKIGLKYEQMNVQSLNNLLLAKQLQNRQTQVKQLKLQNHLLKNKCKKQNKKEQLMKVKMHEMLEHIKNLNYELQRQKKVRKEAQQTLKQFKQTMPFKQYRNFSGPDDFSISSQTDQDEQFNFK